MGVHNQKQEPTPHKDVGNNGFQWLVDSEWLIIGYCSFRVVRRKTCDFSPVKTGVKKKQ